MKTCMKSSKVSTFSLISLSYTVNYIQVVDWTVDINTYWYVIDWQLHALWVSLMLLWIRQFIAMYDME